MSKPFSRWISLFLVLVLCFQLMPVNALAAGQAGGEPPKEIEYDELTGEEEKESVSQRVLEDKLAIVQEDAELREEYTKQFFLDNQQTMAVVYPYSVHYEENGQWVDIDNRLKEETGQYTIPANEGLPTAEYISEEQGGGTREIELPEATAKPAEEAAATETAEATE